MKKPDKIDTEIIGDLIFTRDGKAIIKPNPKGGWVFLTKLDKIVRR